MSVFGVGGIHPSFLTLKNTSSPTFQFICKFLHTHTLCVCVCVCVCVSCSVMCDYLWPHGLYGLPGPFVRGIVQARILEWVAIPFCGGFSKPRDWTRVSCIAGRSFTIWASREALYIHTHTHIYIYISPLTHWIIVCHVPCVDIVLDMWYMVVKKISKVCLQKSYNPVGLIGKNNI